MHPVVSEQTSVPTFFTRERRRKRMLQFLETFERRSWRCAAETPFNLPLPKEDLRASVLVAHGNAQR